MQDARVTTPVGWRVKPTAIILSMLTCEVVMDWQAIITGPLWRVPQWGWAPDGPPASVIARAAAQLEADGLITALPSGRPWRVLTRKGLEAAWSSNLMLADLLQS